MLGWVPFFMGLATQTPYLAVIGWLVKRYMAVTGENKELQEKRIELQEARLRDQREFVQLSANLMNKISEMQTLANTNSDKILTFQKSNNERLMSGFNEMRRDLANYQKLVIDEIRRTNP